tara:strand:+ start:17285 stop:18109 length:825 start_codon:yes stop_codon:yes gene_type:complete
MRNVLIIGCSHSQGYSYYENDENKKLNIESRELGVHGWYTYVDKFKKCDNVFVISTPGSGYAFWSSIFHLGFRDTSFLEKFDTIIIQESHEFRFKVPHETQLWGHLEHDFIRFHENTIENIEVYMIDTKNDALEIGDFKPQIRDDISYLTKKGLKFIYRNDEISKCMLLGSMYTLCENAKMISNSHNIYVWSMDDHYINPDVSKNWFWFKCKYVTRLNLQVDNVYTHLWKNGGLTLPYEKGHENAKKYMFDNQLICHANKEGNKMIGKLINKAL